LGKTVEDELFCVCQIITHFQQNVALAAETGLTAHTDAQIDAQVSSMSATVQ